MKKDLILENIHFKILDTLQNRVKIDISDFQKYQILKNLLYEIDDIITRKED